MKILNPFIGLIKSIIILIGIFLIFLIMENIFYYYDVIGVIVIVFTCICVLIIFLLVSSILLLYMENNYVNILQKKCDPYEAERIYLKKQNKYKNSKKMNLKLVLIINLSAIKIAKGDSEEAIKILEKFKIEEKIYDFWIKALYYDNLLCAYFEAGKLNEVKEVFKKHCYDMLYIKNKNAVHSVATSFITKEINYIQ